MITAEASVSIGSGSSFTIDGTTVSGGEYDLTITSATATPLTAGGVAAVDVFSGGSSTIGAAISVLSSLFGTGADLELYAIYYIDTTADPDKLYAVLATAADGGRPTSMQTTDDSADDYDCTCNEAVIACLQYLGEADGSCVRKGRAPQKLGCSSLS